MRLDLGYDGTRFAGWAAQRGLRTVESTLVHGLATVLRASPDDLRLVVAGRTDAGVHATGQVAHTDVSAQAWAGLPGRSRLDPAAAMVRRLAGVLPSDVRVHAASPAPPGFDARFSALRRRYTYCVCDDEAGVPPLRRHDVLWNRRPLDVRAMDEAAARMVGLHDFAAFCRRRPGATTVRALLEYSWSRDAEGLLVARVVADAFCHSMVRNLVGAALAVGEGRHPPQWPARVLAARIRDSAVGVVPAHGLVLAEVVYPPDDELAVRAEQARATRRLPSDGPAPRRVAAAGPRWQGRGVSDGMYEPGNDDENDSEVIDLDQVLGDDEVDDALDTAWSPPEHPQGLDAFGTTAAEQAQGASLDRRLAAEEPDPAMEFDPVDGQSAAPRSGRLVAPDRGLGPDEEKDLIAQDVGIDAGAASAEEAAMHVVDGDEPALEEGSSR